MELLQFVACDADVANMSDLFPARVMLPPRRFRLSSGGAALGAGLALALSGCSSGTPAASTQTTTATVSPADLVASAMINARAQSWAHVVATEKVGATTATYTQDAGPGRGQQDIEIGEAAAKVIVVRGEAFIQGNSQAITSYFGFPAGIGPTLAGRWISLSPSDTGYATVTDGVSLTSALTEASLASQFTEVARTTRQGQSVIEVQGKTSPSSAAGGAMATLYISATQHPLPVEFDTTSSHGTEKVVFSDWGRAAPLSQPSGAVPVATIPTS